MTSRTNIHPGESLPFLLPKGLSAVLLTGSHKRPHHIAGQPPGLLMFRRRPLLLDSAPPLPESLLTRRIHLSQESTSPRLPYGFRKFYHKNSNISVTYPSLLLFSYISLLSLPYDHILKYPCLNFYSEILFHFIGLILKISIIYIAYYFYPTYFSI